MTYLTPHANSRGRVHGDLTPLNTRIDASGGWWDAGDYLKFLHASTYTEALLLTGVRDFPNQWAPAPRRTDRTSRPRPASARTGC